MNLASGPLTIRLHGIDAPESDQPLGPAATKALRSLVEGRPLEIEPIEQSDAYDRMVAKVFVHGDDVNARMVETGYAWAYRQGGACGWALKRNGIRPGTVARDGTAKRLPTDATRTKPGNAAWLPLVSRELGRPSYAPTRIDTKKGERWFCSVAEAKRAGWRAPK